MAGTEIRFKFHHVDEEGGQVGFLAKKGRFDGETLVLGDDELPIAAIVRADRRFDRIILVVLQENGSAMPVVIAVKSRNVKELLAALNRESSKRWTEATREKLTREGRAAEFRAQPCPYCHSIVDLTGFKSTEQMFCGYCDTIVSLDGQAPTNEQDHALCDSCGYFSRPREFATFYFYFLLIIYGFQHGKLFVCGACMRKEAWKMFLANLIFILGVPFALYQLTRVYLVDKTGLKSSFTGLDKANLLARKGKMTEAILRYSEICKTVTDYSGIRYNTGLALVEKVDMERAAVQFEKALSLCSNHSPSFEAACACHERAGHPERAAALDQAWPGTEPDGKEPLVAEDLDETG